VRPRGELRVSAVPPYTRAVSVTLLFTDIERSTELVRKLGDRYADVLAEHRRLVREAVSAHGGEEIDCRGDEFSIAFDDPVTAVAAARGMQENGMDDVRVRIGIHTGTPLRVEGAYVGLDVHRAARICVAGHGGQVLVSEVTRAGLGDAQLRDLGEHRLKGLAEPERIYQVGPGDFPALRTDASDSALGDRKRVVLADDSVLLREGVASLLEGAGFEVVGQSGTGEDLLLKVRSYKPNIAIVDIRMPPTHTDEGLRAAQEIREKHPDTAVLVLSQYVESGYALELLADSAEGVGYLLKDRVSDIAEFVAAVNRVADGGSALDPEVVSRLVGRRRGSDPLDELTPREREVLQLVAEGRSNRGIAERLVVTERAVEKHVTSIFQKLGLPAAAEDHRRVLATLAYLRA
jgi:DNA-binding NarL/FixJ family response regulator/class 3 adenylate cyclase